MKKMKQIIITIGMVFLFVINMFAQNLNCRPENNWILIIDDVEEGTYPFVNNAVLRGTTIGDNANVTVTAGTNICLEETSGKSFIADSKNGIVFLAYIKPCESYESEVLVPCDNITTELITDEYGGRTDPNPNLSGVEYSDLAYYQAGNKKMLFMPLDDAITNMPDNNGASYISGAVPHNIRAYDLDNDIEYTITLNNMPASFNLGNADFEGMTHMKDDDFVGEDYFAVIDEVTRVVYFLEYSDTDKQLNYINSYDISGETSSYAGTFKYGIEGLSYNPHLNKLYAVSEGFLNNNDHYEHDIIIFELDVISNPYLTNLQLVKSREINLSDRMRNLAREPFFKDAAAIFHLGKVFPSGSESANRFLVLSQQSKKILEMDMDGTFYGALTNAYGGFQPEGIAFVEIDNTRKIVVANEGQKRDDDDNETHIPAKINKYTNACVPGGSPKLTSQGSDFTSITISPNPVINQSAITYNLENEAKVSIQITDVLGAQIVTLVNAEQQAGLKEVIFDASELPVGVYFCALKINKKVSIQKLIKAK